VAHQHFALAQNGAGTAWPRIGARELVDCGIEHHVDVSLQSLRTRTAIDYAVI
jgi:hypothetical protein